MKDKTAHSEIDHSPVSEEEIKGWYSFGVAIEGFSGMAIASFLPIILKQLAAEEAFERSDHSVKCNATGTYFCDVNLFGAYIDTSALVLYTTSISVLLQFILFSSISSMADYGNHRKQFMVGFGLATAILGFGFVFVYDTKLYWLAFLLYIFSNTVLGASYVFHYAWVPVLTRFHPDALKADADPDVSDEEYYRVTDEIGNALSSKGFYWGYVSSVTQMIIGAGMAVALAPLAVQNGFQSVYPMQVAIGLSCIFQFVIFLTHTNRLMKHRAGPPLPEGTNYVSFSLKNLWSTVRQAARLSQLFKFLIAWMIYSDSFQTVVASAILFAQSELGASLVILLGSAIIVPLFAAFGTWFWHKLQFKLGWTTKKTLMVQAVLYCFLPLYGLIGFYTSAGTPFGLNNMYEVPVLGAFHGFLLGATQSSCRVMFSEMIPHGHEAELFGLYQLTDKGSSWIGPLVVGFIADATGTLRWSFVFLLALFFIPIFIFTSVDIVKGKEEARAFIAKENRHSVQHL